MKEASVNINIFSDLRILIPTYVYIAVVSIFDVF